MQLSRSPTSRADHFHSSMEAKWNVRSGPGTGHEHLTGAFDRKDVVHEPHVFCMRKTWQDVRS